MTAAELASMLAQVAERIACDLVPNGKRVGSDWRAGDLYGNPGQSFALRLTGERAGRWIDHASGERGDLLELIRLTHGISFPEACDEARRILGIKYVKLKPREPSASLRHLLDCAAFESIVVLTIVADLMAGEALTDSDHARLRISVSRLHVCREGFSYAT